MRKLVRWVVVIAVLAAASIQFVRPARTNPQTDPGRTLTALMSVPPDAAAILDRSCRDCHSNETRWPWYSSVAPVSWFVIDHVDHGRSHFNYSNWAQYDRAEAARLLKNICTLSRQEAMPMPSYTRMHRTARLDEPDILALCEWADGAARHALR
jgi:hypothetical protein